MKLLSTLTFVLLSMSAFAELGTTIIPGVDRGKLQTALRDKMDVHAVSIVQMKEKKVVNAIDDILSFFDSSAVKTRSYVFTMSVDESLFNKNIHSVECEVFDNITSDDLLFMNCKSNTSTVENMLFAKQILR